MEDKNVLFISNGVYETDGRLRELLKIAKGIGQLTAVVRGKEEKDEKNFHIITQNSFKTFIKK